MNVEIEDIVRKIEDNFAVMKQCYEEAEADGDELAEVLEEVLKELGRIRYFMSMRIDVSREGTVLDYYESLDKDLIDRMMNDAW